jgi:hypothetical protein
MICSRCIYDDSIPGITFDALGVCSYCYLHDQMSEEYPTGAEGWQHLKELASRIKRDRRGDYDCVVGVSGGCDSSYTLKTALELDLRPLAVHFDNGWNNEIAEHNIKVMTEGLGVPLIRHRVDQDEFDSINMAFLRSGVPDFEAPTDIALPTVAYRVAEEYRIKWILNGHSFRTEGITPLGWSYMDGAYIADVCRKFGGPRQFKTYPNLWLKDFVRWSWQGYKRLRPLYYLDYNWKDAQQELSHKFGWKWYGRKHGENDLTIFFSWYYQKRTGNNLYAVRLAALVRSRQMNRDEALEEAARSSMLSEHIQRQVAERFRGHDPAWPLKLPVTWDWDWFMRAPHRTVADFKTYRPAFQRLRLLFWLMYRRGNIPKSFYTKYCLPDRAIQLGRSLRSIRWQ